jgi:hypothetical protein
MKRGHFANKFPFISTKAKWLQSLTLGTILRKNDFKVYRTVTDYSTLYFKMSDIAFIFELPVVYSSPRRIFFFADIPIEVFRSSRKRDAYIRTDDLSNYAEIVGNQALQELC